MARTRHSVRRGIVESEMNRKERRARPTQADLYKVAEDFASKYTGLLHGAVIRPQLEAMQEEMEEQRKLIDSLRLQVFLLNGGTEDGFREQERIAEEARRTPAVDGDNASVADGSTEGENTGEPEAAQEG